MTHSVSGTGSNHGPEACRPEPQPRSKGDGCVRGADKHHGRADSPGEGRSRLKAFDRAERALDKFWSAAEGCVDRGKKRSCDMSRAEKREALSSLRDLVCKTFDRIKKAGCDGAETPPACKAKQPPQGNRPAAPQCDAPKPQVPTCETPKPEAPKPEAPKPQPPVCETPKPETPKPETPKPEMPKPQPPVCELPEPPVCEEPEPPVCEEPEPLVCEEPEPPVCEEPEPPVIEPPKPEAPKPEAPTPETPKPETPKPEAPTPETPKPETPKPEAPTPETPKPETPKPEAPTPETPKPETPKPEAPTPETPKPETPKPEAPTPETPKPETPKPEAPTPESPKPGGSTDAPTTGTTDPSTGTPDTDVPVTADEAVPSQDEIIAAQTTLYADPDNAEAIAVLTAAYYSGEAHLAQTALAAAQPAAIGADATAGDSVAQQTLAILLGAELGSAGDLTVNGQALTGSQTVSAGDVVTNGDGSSLTLTEAQAYEINVRVATAEAAFDIGAQQQAHYEDAVAAGRAAYSAALGAGKSEAEAATAWTSAVREFEASNPEPWAFPSLDENGQSDTLAGLSGAHYVNPPIVQGEQGSLQLHSENQYFMEVSSAGGLHYLEQIGGTPAEALTDIFENAGAYVFDCATGANLVLMKGVLDTVGADSFNAMYPDGLDLSGWGQDRAPVVADHVATATDGAASLPTVYGYVESVAGDIAPFDGSRDVLTIGENVYFETPGDSASFLQGWNAIYLGVDAESGQHLFYSQGAGVMKVRLDAVEGPDGESYVTPTVTEQNGQTIDQGGAVGGTYLGAGSVYATYAKLAQSLAA